MRTIEWDDDRDAVAMVDQTKLPGTYTTYVAETVDELVESIERLRVRGAPALGGAGALGVALATRTNDGADFATYADAVRADADRIANARPTAVNLSREVERVLGELEAVETVAAARERTLERARAICDRDVERNRRLGEHGQTLLSDGDTVMTHCNAGALATVDWGTALGVVYAAREAGKDVSVIANETRPLNQGSRITTVELMERDVETTLIPDNASGLCLQEGRVDAVVVGADRIVLGDEKRKGADDRSESADGTSEFAGGAVFNKIGTYKHAVVADRHDVPFVVAAPRSTIDAATAAGDVPIEERDPGELREIYGERNAPEDVPVYNPAFDPTPMELVDYVVTETGVFEPPLDRAAVTVTEETEASATD